MTRWWAEHAWLGGDQVQAGVLLEADGGRLTTVTAGVAAPADAERLAGVTLPGLANAHSHAFQRAMRGRAQRDGGTFWTWRRDMYALAGGLTPESYRALACAVYAEMALAGITCVGEFHYVHHAPGGTPYAEPNAMGEALVAAAAEAGVRLTLLDACYLAGGFGEDLAPAQRRFADRDADAWAARVDAMPAAPHARVGAAIHSARAVPADALGTVAGWARERGAPLHVHLSEQPAENEACRAAHGCTPTELLEAHGALGPRSCAIHATHLEPADVGRLGAADTTVCLCPTTERDLADGIGPARALADAGTPLALGSDSHAVVDPWEEARAVELDERLASGRRGHWRAHELLAAATSAGHAALGWPEAGRLAPGAPADLVTLRLDSVRLAGARPETLLESVLFAAAPADVGDVVVDGRRVVAGGRHTLVEDVPGRLQATIEAVLP